MNPMSDRQYFGQPEWELFNDGDPHRPWTVLHHGKMIERFQDVWAAQSYVYRRQAAEQERKAG